MKINRTVLMILLLIICIIGISLLFRVVRILNTEADPAIYAATSEPSQSLEVKRQREAQQVMAEQVYPLKIIQLQERINDQGVPEGLFKDNRRSQPRGGSRTR